MSEPKASEPTRPGSAALRQAVAFLTPLGRATPPTPSATAWFPLVGAAVGLALGAAWWAAARIWPPAVAAAVVVVADLAATGMLHFDGLVDSADGLLPHLSRERRLEVMADPAAGAFGVGVGVTVVLLRWTALTTLGPAPLLLAALWCAARTAMATATVALPYARPGGGLATAFAHGRRGPVAAGGALALALAVGWSPGPGTLSVLASAMAAGAVLAAARRRLGGYTGDVLGAAGVVAETVGLLVAAARW